MTEQTTTAPSRPAHTEWIDAWVYGHPAALNCRRLLELLEHLCSTAPDPQATVQWLLKWAAYPLQNPGAKMGTAVLMLGPPGNGKGMFWTAVGAAYGAQAAYINQWEIESPFNAWLSDKRFILTDEFIELPRSPAQQVRLKALITEHSVRIHEKYREPRQEPNQANFVFLSGWSDSPPAASDRRFIVVRTPAGLAAEFYQHLADDLAHGAAYALRDYLLHLPLGDFGPHTMPPEPPRAGA